MSFASRTLLRAVVAVALAFSAQAADFSYYMLSLSYAPEFCALPNGRKDPRECTPGRNAFVVHGLWPQNDNGDGPRNCAPARPVAADLVRLMLHYIPTESLIQHEWATHGTCSGLSAREYFAILQRSRDSVRIPPSLEDVKGMAAVSPSQIEAEFNRANPGIPRDGFRVACYSNGGLEEVRICFDKNLVARSCTGARECTKPTIRLRPWSR